MFRQVTGTVFVHIHFLETEFCEPFYSSFHNVAQGFFLCGSQKLIFMAIVEGKL